MDFGGVTAGGVISPCVETRKLALVCVSGPGVVVGTERGLWGSLSVRVASFRWGELSAAGLPNNPPDVTTLSVGPLNEPPGVPRGGPKGLPNKLLGGGCVGVPPCSSKNPPPGVGWGGVNAVPRLGEGVTPSVDGAPKRGIFAGSEIASEGGVPRENGCIFDRSGFFFCDPGVFHWPKATFGDAGRGFGSGGVTTGDGCFGASWPEIGSLVSGELRVGLAGGLPSPIPYDEVGGVSKVGLSFAGVDGGVVLGSRDCCTEVVSGEGSLLFVDLGVALGEPEGELESGCIEGSREAGKATLVGSGVGLFFLGLCVVSPSSPDSRGSVVSSATGDSS